jgi:hypothetical protein
MNALNDWIIYFNSLGVTCQEIPSNPSAVQLTNVAGCPIFRGVETIEELDDLHTKARQKSSEMRRLLVLGLPFKHPQSLARLPGNIMLPLCRVYGGHVGDTYSTSGHLIESEFLKTIKQEVLSVISNGTKVKTPLCDWVMKLLGKSWQYGTPSSLQQLDSMIGLLSSDVKSIGHVRSRQLSYGRGSGEALFLPLPTVVLPNNALDQSVEVSDMRFISLEAEMKNTNAARARLHPVYSDKYLTVTAGIDITYSRKVGCGAQMGASVLGQRHQTITAVV